MVARPRQRDHYPRVTSRTTIERATLAAGLCLSLGGCNFGGDPVCSALIEYNDGGPGVLDVAGGQFECRWSTSAGQPGSSLRFPAGGTGNLFVTFREPISSSTAYTADVSVDLPGGTYRNDESQPCTVALTRYDIEDWTQYDRHLINGRVTCAGPLETLFDSDDPVMLDAITFGMYSWNDLEKFGI